MAVTDRHPYPFSERDEVLPFVPASAKRILDVGCSRGGFGAALRRQRPSREIWGVEADEEGAAEVAVHYDRILTGWYPDAVGPTMDPFDCVAFNDVLEHMTDPWSALRHTVALLTPTGCVVASLPNVRSIRVVAPLVLLGRWTYADVGILDRTHLRFCTRRSTLQLFRDAGFRKVSIRGINPLGHSPSGSTRLLPYVIGEFAWTQHLVVARP